MKRTRKNTLPKNPTTDPNISKEVMLRNKDTGRWIKRSENELSLSDNCIPTTLIQLTQNNIYYADTKLIISKIIENRNLENLQNLEIKYNNIIDSLKDYQAYSTGIDRVFNNCVEAVNDFENEIRKISQQIIAEGITKQNTDNLSNLAKAYIKILFTHIYSAISIHKEKVKNETVIIGKIKNFKSHIQDLLENTLIPKTFDKKHLEPRESIYQTYIYSTEFNIHQIEIFLKYDRRFDNPLDLIQWTNKCTLQLKEDHYNNYYDKVISGRFKPIRQNDTRMEFLDLLIKILDEIDRLKKIREEINNISSNNILNSFELQVNRS